MACVPGMLGKIVVPGAIGIARIWGWLAGAAGAAAVVPASGTARTRGVISAGAALSGLRIPAGGGAWRSAAARPSSSCTTAVRSRRGATAAGTRWLRARRGHAPRASAR